MRDFLSVVLLGAGLAAALALAASPANWGPSRPDRNIDHRRVPNLARLLQRIGAEVALTPDPAAFRPGESGARMVVHNIGAGTRIEDRLFDHPPAGHFRLTPEALARLRDLQG